MEYMQLSMDDYIQSKNEIKQELGGIVKKLRADRMAADPHR